MRYTVKYPAVSPLATLTVGLCLAALANAKPLDEVRSLVESGQFEAAYKMSQANPQEIGTPHFDFLYGLAALGSGHVPEGILALERHLSTVPANDRARLEMARGYFLLGEYGRARTEFEFVLKHNPPKEVQDNIRRYIESMQTRDSTSLRATSRFYVDAGVGHDSNVNGGTYNNTIELISGIVPINNPSAQAAQDSYRQLTTGGQWVKRVSPQLAVFAGGDFDFRVNNTQGDYNLNNYGVFTGISYIRGAGMYRVSVSDSMMEVNAQQYRDMFSVTAEAQYTVAPGRSLSGFAQYGEASHTGDNRVRDARLATLGATLTQSFEQVRLKPSVGVRASFTQEKNLRMRSDLSRQIQSVRLFTTLTPMDRVGVSIGLNRQQQDFDQADIAFGTVRNDTTQGADIGINFAYNRNWSVRWEWQTSDNQSNQNLYDYTRQTWAAKLRYEF